MHLMVEPSERRREQALPPPKEAAKGLAKRPAVRGGTPARRPAVGGEPQQPRAPGGGAAGRGPSEGVGSCC